MKFFNFFIAVAIMVFTCSLIAEADSLSYREKQKLREEGLSYTQIRKIEEDMEYKYKGASGTKYKYDLSKPSDRIKYSVDPDAKLNDEIYMPITPGVEIDRGLHQYGGGIKK